MAKITCVGCGVMGGSLIRAFMKAGHQVTIVDLNEQAVAPMIGLGAKYQRSLDDALDSELIVLSLPDHAIAESVVANCKPGGLQGKIIVNTTGITPADVKVIENITVEAGAAYIDGAIICYPADIGTESAYIVYSGHRQSYDMIRECLCALSQNPVYLGENAQLAEIIDLSCVGIQYGMYWFALLGAALCMRHGMAVSEYSRHVGPAAGALLNGIISQMPKELENYTGEFQDADVATLEIQTHGLGVVMQALQDSNIDIAVCETMMAEMNKAIAAGYGKKNFEAAITQMLK